MTVQEQNPEPSNPLGLDGIEFIEYATSQPQAFGAVLQQIGADAARDEGRDEDVRIEEQLHETRLNTSSSVKMPCA